jgi:hypothetical protein
MFGRKVISRLVVMTIVLTISTDVNATRQHPDILIYKGDSLSLLTGWGHPSPLQTYFYNNKVKYPFRRLSTANYRGHVAYWKVEGDSLFLSNVQIEDKMYRPQRFGLDGKSKNERKNRAVHANWFTGIIKCRLTNADYEILGTYYFQFRNGMIIRRESVADDEKSTSELNAVYSAYVTCYYRADDDILTWNGKRAYLESDYSFHHSPVYEYYAGFLKWPRNWEGDQEVVKGAPNCDWTISNDSLYLSQLFVFLSSRFDTIEHYTIDLSEEFPSKFQCSSGVFADWANGLFRIEYTEKPVSRWTRSHERGSHTSVAYIRIANGRVIETYRDLPIEHPDYHLYSQSKLKRIEDEYDQWYDF